MGKAINEELGTVLVKEKWGKRLKELVLVFQKKKDDRGSRF